MDTLVNVHDRSLPHAATEGQPAPPAIEIRNISKTFNAIKALDKISLDIYPNEIFALLGANGSGKTTLLRIMSTLVAPDPPLNGVRPSCKILGFNLFRQQDKIRRITGYVPQRDALYENLSALDNVKIFSLPYRINPKIRRARIKELLEQVQLYDRKNALAKTLSGGMAKRLSIICSLVHSPAVLFLDEVTVGLDTDLRRQIWGMLSELKKRCTIVLTTHYIPDAETYCDRVALIHNGHILACGKPAELVREYPPAANLEEATLLCQNESLKSAA